jgi:hypothetical protein
LLQEDGQQISLLDLGKLPRREIRAEQQARKHGGRVLFRAPAPQHHGARVQLRAEILQQRRLAARTGSYDGADVSGARKLAQGCPLCSPEPNFVRRWSCEHSRGRDQPVRFSHQPFSFFLQMVIEESDCFYDGCTRVYAIMNLM